MRTFEFDDSGDWTLEMVSGKDEIVQSVVHSLKTRIKEWFLDESIGLDRSHIESKTYNERLISNDVITTIKQDERVVEVTDLRLDYDRRNRVLGMWVEIIAEINDEKEKVVFDVAV